MNDCDPIIQVSGLTKYFKDFWGRNKVQALRGIDFSVSPGQVFGLLGPNGSGKSTTVKILLGLLRPSSGQIKVLGYSPGNINIKKKVGFLPEETYLYPYLNAEETLDFYASLFSIPKKERQTRIKQLLQMVGLESQAKRRTSEFSKGMARRLGLAAALINDPQLLILDEPTSGLDPIGCAEVKKLIRHLASHGKTILLTSHILGDVEDVVDQVLVLYGGTVRTHGKLRDLLSITDEINLRLENRSPEELQKLKQYLEQQQWTVKDSSHPLRGLEEVFLDLIQQAKKDNITTDGADTGGDIAAYLGEQLDTPDDKQAPLQATPPDDNLTEQKIDSLLTAPAQPEAPQKDNKEEAEVKEEKAPALNQQAVNERLNDLLGKD